jgi:hypothetical protein
LARKVSIKGEHRAGIEERNRSGEAGCCGKGRPASRCHSQAVGRRAGGQHDLPKKQAGALGGLVALTTEHLKKGDKIR